MKKGLLLLMGTIFLGGSFSNSFAQQPDEVVIGNRVYEAKKFRFGVFVAPTISWMKPTANKSNDGTFEASSNGSSVGFQYGFMAEYHFADNYAFVTGLQMNMAKGDINSKNTGDLNANNIVTNADMKYKLNYVEIPLALKMTTDPVENFRFFGQLGFTPGINITRKADYTINYRDENGNPQVAKDENVVIKGALAVSPFLLSMNIGAGAEYPINNKLSAYAGIFFNNGFLPDATNPAKYKFGTPEFKDGNTRVNNFAFRLGLFF